jgi:Na+/melibiose symporter-like transporter
MTNWGSTPREGYEWMGLVLGGIIALTTILVFFGTAKAPSYKSDDKPIPLMEQIKVARKNKPFMTLIKANIIQYTSAGLGYAGSPIFLAYAVGLEEKMLSVVAIWILLMAGTSVLSMPVFVWAAARWGKINIYIWCLIMYGLTTPVYFLADAQTLWPVWVASITIGFFNSGFILMSFSTLTDTIAYDRVISGFNREGALSAVYSAVDKACNALGSVIFVLFLSAIGFVTTNDGTFAKQSDDAIRAIWFFFILGPVLLHWSSIFILRKYDLTDEQLAAAPAE